jgi:MoaA/NifB/PqqE/SkfB family radical SAM enzyme
MLFKRRDPIAGSIKIAYLGISDLCPNMCSDCATGAHENGYQMPFPVFETILSFNDLRFNKNEVCITYGEPLYYYNNGKDVSDITSVLLAKGIERISIFTSGLWPGHEIPLNALESLAKHKEKLLIRLSINLFQGEEKAYWEKMVYTSEILFQLKIPIGQVHTTYSVENRLETQIFSSQFLDFLKKKVEQKKDGSTPTWELTEGQIWRLERGVNVTKYDIKEDSAWDFFIDCNMYETGSQGRNLTIRSNGDLTPCIKPPGAHVVPVANVVEHTWDGVLFRYKAYLDQFNNHMEKKPEGVHRCVWHMNHFKFQPPPMKSRHLRRNPMMLKA